MLFTIALCSCAQNSKMDANESVPADAASSSLNVSQTSDPYSDPRSKLIKTADYRFRVADLKKSTESIENQVRKFPAHISQSNLSFEGNTIENSMTIRVRSESFHDLLKEIDREASYVHFRNIRTEDVAKQFVDLESRLKTKREVQERYKEILRTKAGKIEELLAAERQIGELQEEIEAAVSKLNYLKDQVAYSTINLTFYEKVEENIAQEDGPLWEKFAAAFSSGFTGATNVLVAITTLWPLIAVVLIGFFVVRKKKLFPVAKP
jgi:DNA repair exonuclease SbcCD ATPase subunit